MIKRDKYLNEIVSRMHNGMIKVITGLRRSGKSFLLDEIFYNYLIEHGVKNNQIIKFAFDNKNDLKKLDKYYQDEETIIYQPRSNKYNINSKKFNAFIEECTNDTDDFFLLLDEVQLLEHFEFTLNGFLYNKNFDVYVTGSNSKFLSSDIITEFRGRGDQVHVLPLSFKEFYDHKNVDFKKAYVEYSLYGGMPQVLFYETEDQKANYLKELYNQTYIIDIVERNNLRDTNAFGELINVISSSIGSYTNATNIEKTFKSKNNIEYNHVTIQNHLDYLIDAFLINKVYKYDIKGRKYINANYKYYFTDIGLRNARLNFRQNEPTHIMENIIYNELLYRGYNVDVGIVEIFKKNKNNNNVRVQLETDFVCNKGNEKVYIQSVYMMYDNDKYLQESNSLKNIGDSFKKIIIAYDALRSYYTEDGIYIMSLEEFLLGKEL